MRKYAFTLAETLITLMVIGVVAVLTIPALMQQISNETLKGQRIATGAKLAKGFAQMRSEGALEEKYSNTAEFVEKMKQYFQITQVCDSNSLTNCFVETVTSGSSEEPTQNNINEIADKSNVMGLKFADGTSMLIKYNPESELAGNGWSDSIVNSKSTGKIGELANKDSYPTYSDLFYYVVDVNNTKNPNTQGKDIVGNLVLEKGAAGSDFGLGFEIIDNTVFETGCSAQYWGDDASVADSIACLQSFCAEKGGRMPTRNDIYTIVNTLFDDNGGYYLKSNYNPSLLSILSTAGEIAVSDLGNGSDYAANFYAIVQGECTVGNYCGIDPDTVGCFCNAVPSQTICIK